MKKILFIIMTAFFAVNSYGQVYDICYDNTCTPPIPVCTIVYTPPGCAPGWTPTLPPYCPIECRNPTIINDLDCDLDFWWDYTASACGDVIPAYWDGCAWLGYGYCSPNFPPAWPMGIPYFAHVVPKHDMRTLVAYKVIWPNCPDPACSCPTTFHWRMDTNLYNNTTANMQPDLFGTSFTLTSSLPPVDNYVANYLDCSGATFYIHHNSSTDTYTFNYIP